jgi:hypothetical protein
MADWDGGVVAAAAQAAVARAVAPARAVASTRAVASRAVAPMAALVANDQDGGGSGVAVAWRLSYGAADQG